MSDESIILGVSFVEFPTVVSEFGRVGARAPRAHPPARASAAEPRVHGRESAARACRPVGCRDDSYRGTGVCEKNVHLLKLCQSLHVCPPPPKFNVGTRQS